MTANAVADGKLTYEQRGRLAAKKDELTRRANEGTLSLERLLDNLQSVIEGQFVKSPNSPLLVPVGTVTARAHADKRTVAKAIRVDTSETAPVLISYVDPVIHTWFGKLTVEHTTDSALASSCLTRQSRDFWIIGSLEDGKEETTWGEIYSLMLAQSRGQEGTLLNTGSANIFYVLDADGELRSVFVSWHGGGWSVYFDTLAP